MLLRRKFFVSRNSFELLALGLLLNLAASRVSVVARLALAATRIKRIHTVFHFHHTLPDAPEQETKAAFWKRQNRMSFKLHGVRRHILVAWL